MILMGFIMIVTRFAPSPTGVLHIGSARTALFNWLYAKHTNGKFLLRIEDTDKQRSTDEATAAIIDGLKWLGLAWDGDIILQSTRAQRHKEVALQMIENGTAYYCYATPEDIQAFRENNPYEKFISPWRDGKKPAVGSLPVIRLKADKEEDSIINDVVQGEVTIANSQLDDMILLRSDGTPTYMLAVVVDDHDMGVNTVIRGDDHFTNTFRQNQIYKAMSWDIPKVYAHIPLIHGPDGHKLSKRHGATGVGEYRDMGYLPEAIISYLLRLGWSNGDDEIIPLEKAISLFGLEGLGKSPSRFDFAKLDSVNACYIRLSSQNSLFALLQEKMRNENFDKTVWDIIYNGIPLIQERAVTINELSQAAGIFIKKSSLTEKAKEVLGNADEGTLTELYDSLCKLEKWEGDKLSSLCKELAAKLNIKMAIVMQLLRASVVGTLEGPGIVEIMTVLGKNETLRRMKY